MSVFYIEDVNELFITQRLKCMYDESFYSRARISYSKRKKRTCYNGNRYRQESEMCYLFLLKLVRMVHKASH